VELFCPPKVASFEDDFSAFALTAGAPQVSEKIEIFTSRDRGLDTTLVAGMFFQVMVEAEKLPANIPERVSFVRKEAKNFLVDRLAGQITLTQFFRLLSLIEEKVQHYFQHLEGDWAPRRPQPRVESATAPPEATSEGAELIQVLSRIDIPQKGRRITFEGLGAFLRGTRGRWFRLLDLEAHFQVNKKTAWSYLNLLLKAGILEHNGEKANRVRYALAGPYRMQDPGAGSTR
jgi:hypothetical protein